MVSPNYRWRCAKMNAARNYFGPNPIGRAWRGIIFCGKPILLRGALRFASGLVDERESKRGAAEEAETDAEKKGE
jgi:hypothetical protein